MNPFLRQELDEIKELSTSNTELQEKMGYNIPVVKYNELINYNDIDQLLGPKGECIILYETAPNIGHWVCCFKRGNKISFFDSLGLKPDDQFHQICIKFRKDNGINKPYLTYLLSSSPYKVEYNEYKLQNPDPEVATCGRWVINRLRLKHLTPKQFYNLYKKGPHFDSDDLVILTY